jgi:hypothetical protein
MKLKEYRPDGNRNFVRLGDVVKVLPAPGIKGTSFEAIVRGIEADAATGQVKVVEVLGGKKGRLMTHHVRPERIKRVAQVRTSPVEGKVRRERKR